MTAAAEARQHELRETRDARLAVRLALAATVEPDDRTMTPRLRGLDPFAAWELVRTDAGGKFTRSAARVKALRLDALVARTQDLGARVVIPGDAEWPSGVDDLVSPPYCLWVLGSASLAQACERSLSMVGARAATPYGTQVAGELAYGLSGRGFTIVSGAAHGIDTASHRGALAAGGCTIAAMACGIDIAYPLANAGLLQQIEQSGVIVTELPPGSAPQKQRFLSRNRLIAAMSPGTVVVEAGLRSGSRSTATAASRLGRLLAAVPGPVTSPASAGPHQLIRDCGATLVTDVDDCAELFGAIGTDLGTVKRAETTVSDRLDEPDKRLLDAMPVVRGTTIAKLAVSACLTSREVTRGLAALHAAGLVERVESGWRRTQETC
ncbi:DNA processing protein DprA [Flexivirga endophytica]|uniref:DNA processing protein DprA n=1 Tax=Flexivirga endophytica TaxID=1849103 RepID=A0A916WPC7_9MICO|nr:DNA-processing protein DprA [Flexivirga endophytica]GGB19892.1 DNA processing protein DprA [Flexivirga endophytica]GHB35823.1 DNA processing protein DprA [Flexivirga endophytica]